MECLFNPKVSVLKKKLAQKKSLRGGGKSRPEGGRLRGGKSRPEGGRPPAPPTSRAYEPLPRKSWLSPPIPLLRSS